MDPAFGTRTLTLVDGRRVVSTSNQADVVDMNIIPSNLLQRMDVVTGGASATYGSGAMAGVVNLVLNNRLTGFNLDMDYGINEAGDGGSPHYLASPAACRCSAAGPTRCSAWSGRTQLPSATAPRRATGAPNRAPCSPTASGSLHGSAMACRSPLPGLRGPSGPFPDGEHALQPVLARTAMIRHANDHS